MAKYKTITDEALLEHDKKIAELTKKYIDKNKGADVLFLDPEAGQYINADNGAFKLKIYPPTAYAVTSHNVAEIFIPEGSSPTVDPPKMDGVAAVGTDIKFARGDHVHPTDTSRASQAALSALEAKVTALTEMAPSELDTLKEITDYIKANRTLIESVTTTKVNVSDMEIMTKEQLSAIAKTACEAIYV